MDEWEKRFNQLDSAGYDRERPVEAVTVATNEQTTITHKPIM